MASASLSEELGGGGRHRASADWSQPTPISLCPLSTFAELKCQVRGFFPPSLPPMLIPLPSTGLWPLSIVLSYSESR